MQSKPFTISKKEFVEAFKRVKANGGSEGVDGQSVKDFESNLTDNLYKLWNRMSSGSYYPPSVLKVEIPKGDGSTRVLGVPTVADRIAQTVVKSRLEPRIDPLFHEDSYGYRPGRSAIKAIEQTRRRCWKYDWVIDLDIKGFFDNLDHDLIMKAVKIHVKEKWILLYIERWLKAPLEDKGGGINLRTKGTPQGGVISPLLANLFLHYGFDKWMTRVHPGVEFARFADDIVVHCDSKAHAEGLKAMIEARLKECGLELHPDKTKVVYCKDDDRSGSHSIESFDFLGYTFRPRGVRFKSELRVGFTPGVSNSAKRKIRRVIKGWKLHRMTTKSLWDLATYINPIVRGWFGYYGRFYKSALYCLFKQIQAALVKWVQRKYKHLKRHKSRARSWLLRLGERSPQLFYHWRYFRW
ncbi:MAG: group II intron reverse transcriptase/maturase [bacterium]|nr:group II intron reverse transcriptase/maturase [bacterium]